jgi:hypothetical protein
VTLRTYAGTTAAVANTKGYKETGLNGIRLEVKDNKYYKSSARVGIGIRQNQIQKIFIVLQREGESRIGEKALTKQ